MDSSGRGASVLILSKGDGALVRVHAFHNSQGLEVVALFAQGAAALLEALLHGDADALDDDLGVVADVDQTVQCVALGQEVVKDQHMLALLEEALGHDDGVLPLLGEGVDAGRVLVAVKVDGLGLLGEDHRHVPEVAGGQAGDADAGCLDGQNLVDPVTGEQAGPFSAHVVEEPHVALMVEEGVHLEYIARLDRALAADSLLKFLHVIVLVVMNAGPLWSRRIDTKITRFWDCGPAALVRQVSPPADWSVFLACQPVNARIQGPDYYSEN